MTKSPAPARSVCVVARSVSFGDGVGGLERAVADHVEALLELGWAVTLCSPPNSTIGAPARGGSRFEVLVVAWPLAVAGPGRPGFGFAYRLWVARVRRTLSARRFDALYLHGASAGVLLGSPLDPPVRTVVNPHGMEEFASGGFLKWTNRVFTRRMVRAARVADAVIATDLSLVDAVKDRIGVDRDRIVVIPNAVDVGRLDELATSDAPVEAGFFRLVSVGRLVENKGYDLLADALRLIAEGQRLERPLWWTHFGSGPRAADVVERMHGAPEVRFELVEGADDRRVHSTLKSADLFVQPSRYEGSSLTTLEAMAHGVTCVGTPVGGIPDKLIEGETGFLAEEVSSQALVRAIERAASAEAAVGARARQRVLADFDLEVVAGRLSELLAGEPPA